MNTTVFSCILQAILIKQWEVTLDRSNSAQIDLIKYQLRFTNKYFTFTKNHKEFPLTLNKTNMITRMRKKLNPIFPKIGKLQDWLTFDNIARVFSLCRAGKLGIG